MPDIMTSRAFQKFEVKWFTVAWRGTMIHPTLNKNSIVQRLTKKRQNPRY